MKLLRVGEKNKEKPAILDKEGNIRDLSKHISDLDPNNLNFETFEKIKQIDPLLLPEISNKSRVGSCITKPGKFIAIGLNFSDHAAETGAKPPTEPIVFMKATSSVNGPNDNIEITNYSKKLDWEVELGLVIGKNAKNIPEENSQDYILGYCLVNDVSEREWQIEKMGQWVKGKSHDTFGPVGPYLVTKDEINDVNNLNIRGSGPRPDAAHARGRTTADAEGRHQADRRRPTGAASQADPDPGRGVRRQLRLPRVG